MVAKTAQFYLGRILVKAPSKKEGAFYDFLVARQNKLTCQHNFSIIN